MTHTDTVPFTIRDYRLLPEDFRAYLLDGQLVREAAPTWRHQTLALRIAGRLEAVAPRCVLVSPADLLIDDLNVLQPDVLVFEPDVDLLHAPSGLDLPDVVPRIVIEVLSPSTAARDRGRKTELYLQKGIAEVWRIDPDARSIEVVRADGEATFSGDERAVSSAVPGFALAWSDLS